MTPEEKLLNHIQELVELKASDHQIILEKFVSRKLKKKEMVLQQGDISFHTRFITEGCLRTYYLDEEGKEHIVQFAIEGWWINDIYSFLTQTPARQFIEAVAPSTIMQIHRDALESLYSEVPAIERFFRLKIQAAYVAALDRTVWNMTKTAEERYILFRKKYRDIEQRIPQYMIASYLGITPEFLSALRKKLSQH